MRIIPLTGYCSAITILLSGSNNNECCVLVFISVYHWPSQGGISVLILLGCLMCFLLLCVRYIVVDVKAGLKKKKKRKR